MELQLDVISLDEDVLSFHLPSFFNDFFVEGDQSWLPWIARGLLRILYHAGPCHSIQGIGTCARMITDLLMRAIDDCLETSTNGAGTCGLRDNKIENENTKMMYASQGGGLGRGLLDEEGYPQSTLLDPPSVCITSVILVDRTVDLVCRAKK